MFPCERLVLFGLLKPVNICF